MSEEIKPGQRWVCTKPVLFEVLFVHGDTIGMQTVSGERGLVAHFQRAELEAMGWNQVEEIGDAEEVSQPA